VIVYLADKAQFLRDNDNGEIDEIIDEHFRDATGHTVGKAELRSWQSSLGQMAGVLRDDGIPTDTGVAVEYHIPQSSKRIDVTLTGRGPNDEKNAIVIELKQWDAATSTTRDAIYNGHIALQPCAYLHNYGRDGEIDAPAYSAYIEKAPLFLKGEAETQRLRDFIKRHIKKRDRSEILYEIENGEIRPSKALADSLAGLLKGNREFVLIDDQKTVYEAAIAATQSASATNRSGVSVRVQERRSARRVSGEACWGDAQNAFLQPFLGLRRVHGNSGE
jgi:hypothetical protein